MMNFGGSGGGGGLTLTRPISTDYSWDNQGTSTVTDGTNAMILAPQADGQLHGFRRALPATPWNVYACIDMTSANTSVATALNYSAGIKLTDNTGNDALMIGSMFERASSTHRNGLIIQRWTNSTTWNSTVHQTYTNENWRWLRAHCDGTTITVYGSVNGVDWLSVYSEAVATFLGTVNRYGPYAYAPAAATNMRGWFSHFGTSEPS